MPAASTTLSLPAVTTSAASGVPAFIPSAPIAVPPSSNDAVAIAEHALVREYLLPAFYRLLSDVFCLLSAVCCLKSTAFYRLPIVVEHAFALLLFNLYDFFPCVDEQACLEQQPVSALSPHCHHRVRNSLSGPSYGLLEAMKGPCMQSHT
jgi:hypothetical protein